MKFYLLLFLVFISTSNCTNPKEKDDLLKSWILISSQGDSLMNIGYNILQNYKAIDSNNAEIYYQEAYYYCIKKMFDSAIIRINVSISKDSNFADSYNLYAKILGMHGDTAKAIELYKKSLSIIDSEYSVNPRKEWVDASFKMYLIYRLFGKDSAYSYYYFIKKNHKMFDRDDAALRGLNNFNLDSSIKHPFDKKLE
jgi:tetratricopeptide (TPR) repeat protein